MSDRPWVVWWYLISSVVISSFIITVLYIVDYHSTEHYDTVRVVGKYIAYNNGKSYRIETDNGVFIVDDSIFQGRFNAAELYANLKINSCYKFRSVGWHWSLFSVFPGIYEPQKIDCK